MLRSAGALEVRNVYQALAEELMRKRRPEPEPTAELDTQPWFRAQFMSPECLADACWSCGLTEKKMRCNCVCHGDPPTYVGA